MKITIANKEYNVKEAKTNEEREKGLLDVESLSKDEGMLFYFDFPLNVSMWMKNTLIPLDIIYINEDLEVIYVYKGLPKDEKLVTIPDTQYVLEVNQNSGIKIGDELDFDEELPVMKVLFPDGSEQMALFGGERIFSRKNTRVLIRKAKKADLTKEDSDYKALGKFMFKCIKILDERPAEYVESPSNTD